MLISHSKKFVFVHIYKTAGTSVMNVLLPYGRFIDRLVFDFWLPKKIISQIIKIMGWSDDGQKQFTGVHKHAPASAIRTYMGLTYDKYHSFVFVRNPFDLLVSLYFYISQARLHKHHKLVANMEFKEFVKWHIASNPPRQIDFITDSKSKKIIVDYIGRFETLNDDLGTIVAKLGIDDNRNLSHKNHSRKRKSKDYKEYFDEETQVLAQNYFQKDLDAFGYRFNGEFSNNIPCLEKN